MDAQRSEAHRVKAKCRDAAPNKSPYWRSHTELNECSDAAEANCSDAKRNKCEMKHRYFAAGPCCGDAILRLARRLPPLQAICKPRAARAALAAA